MNFAEILAAKGREAGMTFTQTELTQFGRYYELLIEYNKVMNLTTITEPGEVAVKHMLDSLTAYSENMAGKTLADVGTGAGFPGVPLKIRCPSLSVTLIDSLQKRLNFLSTVINKLGLSGIETLHARAEDAGRNRLYRAKFDFVTARAVAKLAVLAEYCLPLLKVGGEFIALKGDFKEEVAEGEAAVKLLGGKIIAVEPVKLPEFNNQRVIIRVKKIKATPAVYPRRAGTPVKQPLGK